MESEPLLIEANVTMTSICCPPIVITLLYKNAAPTLVLLEPEILVLLLKLRLPPDISKLSVPLQRANCWLFKMFAKCKGGWLTQVSCCDIKLMLEISVFVQYTSAPVSVCNTSINSGSNPTEQLHKAIRLTCQ